MIAFLRSLFCRHGYAWRRNIHGDEIIACGFKRSVWRCTKCGAIQWRGELHQDA